MVKEQALSRSPSERSIGQPSTLRKKQPKNNDDLNGDIMVLISKPRVLQPLRTNASCSSIGSLNDSDDERKQY